jgi:hypothetical protein
VVGISTVEYNEITECPDVSFGVREAVDYAVFGLRVRSSIPLSLAPLAHSGDTTPDLTIVLSPDVAEPTWSPAAVIASAEHGVIARYYRNDSGSWIWNNLAGTCRISADGRQVAVDPERVASVEALGQLLTGQIAVLVLLRRGVPVLHASAVTFDEGAIAFMAPSGHGKTTMAASFLTDGATILTDDALPLLQRSDGVYGVPGVPSMKVWPATAELCLGVHEDLQPLVTAPSKRLLHVAGRFSYATEPALLRAIYVLRRYAPELSGCTDIMIRPLTGRDRVAALLSNTLQRATLNPQETARMLPTYARLAAQVPVKVLAYPEGFAYQPAVRETVLADLEDRQ